MVTLTLRAGRHTLSASASTLTRRVTTGTAVACCWSRGYKQWQALTWLAPQPDQVVSGMPHFKF